MEAVSSQNMDTIILCTLPTHEGDVMETS